MSSKLHLNVMSTALIVAPFHDQLATPYLTMLTVALGQYKPSPLPKKIASPTKKPSLCRRFVRSRSTRYPVPHDDNCSTRLVVTFARYPVPHDDNCSTRLVVPSLAPPYLTTIAVAFALHHKAPPQQKKPPLCRRFVRFQPARYPVPQDNNCSTRSI